MYEMQKNRKNRFEKAEMARKAFLFSLFSMFFCVLMLAGITYAWMTDTVTSGNNRILAGNTWLTSTCKQAELAGTDTAEDSRNNQAKAGPGLSDAISGLFQAMNLTSYAATQTATASQAEKEISAEKEESKVLNLKIVPEEEDWDSIDTLFSGEDEVWYPGQMKAVCLRLSNEGTIAVQYDLYLTISQELTGITDANEAYVISDKLGIAITEVTPDADPDSAEDSTELDQQLFGSVIEENEDYSQRKDLTAMWARIINGDDPASGEMRKAPGTSFATTKGHSKDFTGALQPGATKYVNLIIYLPAEAAAAAKTGSEAPFVRLGLTIVAKQLKEAELENAEQQEETEVQQETENGPLLTDGALLTWEAPLMTTTPFLCAAAAPEALSELAELESGTEDTSASEDVEESVSETVYPSGCMIQHLHTERLILKPQEYEQLAENETVEEETKENDSEGLNGELELIPGFDNIQEEAGMAEVSVFRKDILYKELKDGTYQGTPGLAFYRNTAKAKEKQSEPTPEISADETKDAVPSYANAADCYSFSVALQEEKEWPENTGILCYSFRVNGLREGTRIPKTLRFYIGTGRSIQKVISEDEAAQEEDLTLRYLYNTESGILQFTTYQEGLNLLTIYTETEIQ